MEERYHQQFADCGKPTCRTCREGRGHGPYWYAYRVVDGQTKRRYVGRVLPPGVALAVLQFGQAAIQEQAHQSEPEVRLFLLGALGLERRTEQEACWTAVTDARLGQRVVRGLLACLLSVEGRYLVRDQVIDALWPDDDLTTGSAHLDRAVYSLRQIFEPERRAGLPSSFVQNIQNQIVLADQATLWCDADAFVSLLQDARRAKERSDQGRAELFLEKATTLYRGAYLSECIKNCILGEDLRMLALARREALRRQWIGALLELADLRIERLAYTEALEPLDRILSVDPTNEAAAGRLMRVLFWLDRRSEAMRAYRGLSLALSRSYQTTPLKKVRLLSGSIRSGEWRETVVQGHINSREVQHKPVERDVNRLVGREKETEQLAHWMTKLEHMIHLRLRGGTKPALITDPDARSIERCLLFIGEKGIGKTRLGQEAASLARARGWLTIEIQAHDQEYPTEYSLWTRLLRRLPVRARVSQEEFQSRPLMLHSLKKILPEFDAPHVVYHSPPPPIQERFRLWESIARLLALMAQKGPLFLVLDDLHYADESSCALLAYLARRWLGVFVMATSQREGLPPLHPLSSWLMAPLQQHIKVLQIPPLSTSALSSLISEHHRELPDTVVQTISKRAAGNPYFALELAQALSSEQMPDNQHHLMQELDGFLPDILVNMFRRSLSRLGKEAKTLLAKAALFGPTFTFEQLYTLETLTAKTDEVWLFHALEEAVEAGLLRETWSGTQTTYSFWHPLFADYLSRRISAERRIQLQHQIITLPSSL